MKDLIYNWNRYIAKYSKIGRLDENAGPSMDAGEEDEDTEKKPRLTVKIRKVEDELEEDCSGNPFHDNDGKWSSSKNPGSWSKRSATCDDRGQHKRGASATRGVSREKCGREDRSRLCKGGEVKEHLVQEADVDAGLLLKIREIVASMIRSKSGGRCSSRDFLKYINSIAVAEKGELLKSRQKKG